MAGVRGGPAITFNNCTRCRATCQPKPTDRSYENSEQYHTGIQWVQSLSFNNPEQTIKTFPDHLEPFLRACATNNSRRFRKTVVVPMDKHDRRLHRPLPATAYGAYPPIISPLDDSLVICEKRLFDWPWQLWMHLHLLCTI